jgi:hypothetical protein
MFDGAAGVLQLIRGIDVAVVRLNFACECSCGFRDGAIGPGVECHCVVLLVIDALEDVNLAAVRNC